MARRQSAWASKAAALTGSVPTLLAPFAFAPQLAVSVDEPPRTEQWLHELKWDGYRLVASVVEGKAHVWSRNALPWNSKVRGIVGALEQLGVSASFDGELVANTGSREDFGALQEALSGKRRAPMTLVLFDLLHLEGFSIERAPLIERKALLAELLGKKPPAGLAYSSHGHDAEATFEMAVEREFEGIISKRIDGPYLHSRSDMWRKTKVLETEEFAVVGYAPSESGRNPWGSLLLARPVDGRWVYAGRVGSGLSDSLRRSLEKHLQGGGPTPTVEVSADRPSLRRATWFEPRFVAEVFVRGFGTSGVLRQPSLKAIRPDKQVEDLAPLPRRRAPS